MNHYYSYLNSTVQILNQYKGKEPFALFIKKHFSINKKHGSKDRKQISHLCYCYFRLGKSLPGVPVRERILAGLFLCSEEPNEMLSELKPEWNEKIKLSVDEKYSLLNIDSIFNVFPWDKDLSTDIDFEKFCRSFFVQPDLFLRLRPGHENAVRKKLLRAAIHFKEITPFCLSIPNNSKIENSIELDKEAVVQDYSSQRVGDFFRTAFSQESSAVHAWDCCAASGGKSLLLYDINRHIDLTVSDTRESILVNLKKRFLKAGIKRYKSFVADLAENLQLPGSNYDLIICDAPCTGSGTWGRTPERLYFFDQEKIEQYASLQKKIVMNIIPHLKEKGYLVYITCSVFKKENEEIVGFIKNKFRLEMVKTELLKGYDKKADTMFSALFRKS
jgi:16S rRNA (cytosine967-C5)-methyltransferase